VLASRGADGSQHIIDDFREAYYWLRQNTKEDAVVMSWWDYGYQIASLLAIAFPTVAICAGSDGTSVTAWRRKNGKPTVVPRIVVDNRRSIGHTGDLVLGKAMASNEAVAYPILRKHDVDYILVIFGGLLGYSGYPQELVDVVSAEDEFGIMSIQAEIV
jgi:dolichyl-diphosphooligosaccharide--protein glycosyltransferase